MDFKSNEQSIIEEDWSEKDIETYVTNFWEQKCKAYTEYRLSLQEKLFLTSIVSYFAENRSVMDKIMDNTQTVLLSIDPTNEKKWRYTGGSLKVFIVESSFYVLWLACLFGVSSWQSLRKSEREKLCGNISLFLFLLKDITDEKIDNYERWKSYVKTKSRVMPMPSLFSKLAQFAFHPLTFDSHLDLVVHVYSCYYYLYDKTEIPFSDNIFDTIRLEKSKWAHRLYYDLNCTDFRHEIHLEYLDYCDRKGIQERDLFKPKRGKSQKATAPSPNNGAITEINTSVMSEDYYSKLALKDKGIRNLYNLLVEEGFIVKDTPYSVFHFRLSGRDKPDNLTEIVWLKDKKELCYFIYRLTRTNILDKSCSNFNTTRDFNKKTMAFFIVKGSSWDQKDNLSDMANKLSILKKQEIFELFKKSLEQP